MDPFLRVVTALNDAGVRYVVTGVWGANYYALGTLFVTSDQDLLLPRDAANLLRAWQACEALGLELLADLDPLDRPRDATLARAVVDRVALTSAVDGQLLHVDFSLVMGAFSFDEVWTRRRTFHAHRGRRPQPGGLTRRCATPEGAAGDGYRLGLPGPLGRGEFSGRGEIAGLAKFVRDATIRGPCSSGGLGSGGQPRRHRDRQSARQPTEGPPVLGDAR